jgi:hypothetical protein
MNKESHSFIFSYPFYLMTEYRDEKLIKQLEAEIEANKSDFVDCLSCLCFGELALLSPKVNKRAQAEDRLILELKKPKYVPDQKAAQ